METLTTSLEKNVQLLTAVLTSKDILVHPFNADTGCPSFAVLYADGMVNKEFLGALTLRPLSDLSKENLTAERIQRAVPFP